MIESTLDTDTVTEEMAQVDPAYWASLYAIKLQATKFSFKDHEYQAEPMSSSARRRCFMKGTQGGFSEIEVLRTLHGLIHQRLRKGALYMFPTNDDVIDFSRSRFNPLILANNRAIGRYVKPGGKGTDTINLKKVHEAFLYLRGARLSQKVGIGADEKESSRLRSIPVDSVTFDEVDLMDPQSVEKAIQRMGASTIKEETYISNPTLPDRGIHEIFKLSDQRYFHLRCTCGEWTCAALEFPECVHLRQDRTGYIACKKCGKELNSRTNGEWVPTVRDNSDYMHGYHWGQLNSAFSDPGEILAKYNDPPLGNMGDVMRLSLGFPYVSSEDRLTGGIVRETCLNEPMPMSNTGPCAMGVDVGKIKHIVIGQRTGKDRYEILKVAKVSRWEDIYDLAKLFGVRSAVIDIRPYEDEARKFQKAEPYRIFLCEYTDNPTHEADWSNKTGIVKVYRTGIFDRTHRLFTEQEIAIPRRCNEMDAFIEQVCGTAKVLETNQRSGTSVYRYRSCGNAGDHYRNALNYFYLAAKGGRIAQIGNHKPRQKKAVNTFAVSV